MTYTLVFIQKYHFVYFTIEMLNCPCKRKDWFYFVVIIKPRDNSDSCHKYRGRFDCYCD